MKEPEDMPLFGAEGLRQLERVNEEIARNGRAGQKHQPALPLFTTSDPEARRRTSLENKRYDGLKHSLHCRTWRDGPRLDCGKVYMWVCGRRAPKKRHR